MDWKPTSTSAPATLSETIYQALKKAIIDGEIKPGQRLQDKEIAGLFHSSATPVREAFFRLAAEKYLVLNARKEVLVQDATFEEVLELYEIVRVLDKHAVRIALRSLGPGEIGKLRDMTRELERLHGAGDHQGYLEQNLAIHDFIWRQCRNNFLHEILGELMAKIGIYRRNSGLPPFTDPKALEKSLKDHQNIQRYLEEGNLKALEKLIDAHWGEEFIVG